MSSSEKQSGNTDNGAGPVKDPDSVTAPPTKLEKGKGIMRDAQEEPDIPTPSQVKDKASEDQPSKATKDQQPEANQDQQVVATQQDGQAGQKTSPTFLFKLSRRSALILFYIAVAIKGGVWAANIEGTGKVMPPNEFAIFGGLAGAFVVSCAPPTYLALRKRALGRTSLFFLTVAAGADWIIVIFFVTRMDHDEVPRPSLILTFVNAVAFIYVIAALLHNCRFDDRKINSGEEHGSNEGVRTGETGEKTGEKAGSSRKKTGEQSYHPSLPTIVESAAETGERTEGTKKKA